MPYRGGNFSFVVDSSFRPFTMQEILTPLTMYKDAYDKTEEAYTALADKADKFKYLSTTLPEDSEARQIYERYANDLKIQAEDLGKHGLTVSNRRALNSLRNRYQGEIGMLADAQDALTKERELRRQMGAKDPSMLYGANNLTINDYLYGNMPSQYSVSGDALFTRGAAIGKSLSSRMYKEGDGGSTLGGYYRQWVTQHGVAPQSIEAFMQSDEVQQEINRQMKATGAEDNLTGIDKDRARYQLESGLYNGIVYEQNIELKRDESRMSAAEDAQYALQRESLDRQAAAQGLIYDKDTKSFKYDIRRDPKYADELWKYKIDENTGQILGYSSAYEDAVKKGMVSPKGRSSSTSSNGVAKSNPADVQKLAINNGVTSNGTVLTREGDDTSVVKMDMTAQARYAPFYGDAWNNDAKNGFDELDWEGTAFNENDAEPYKFSQLKSDEAKQQIRDYVQELIPDVVTGLTQAQLDEVISYMDFTRDYDMLSDNHFRLAIPGVNNEGKIIDKNKFNTFLSKVNRLRLRDMMERDAVTQGVPAGVAASTTDGSVSVDNMVPVNE